MQNQKQCVFVEALGRESLFSTTIIIIKKLNKAQIGNDNSVFEQLPSKTSLLFCSSSGGEGGGKGWQCGEKQ